MPDAETRVLVVAGLSGGTGKSVVSMGLTAALAAQGRVVPFKKGPDYIDAGWLALAAGAPCYNLDPYLMDAEVVASCFSHRLRGFDFALVEGNRGIYDGVTAEGGYSTAELALQLDLPVLLVVNCAKTTRTVAAMVLGCLQLDPRVQIGGVVLNQIATPRHEAVVRAAVETYTGVPVYGVMPRLPEDVLPMRHLGVTPHQEYAGAGRVILHLRDQFRRSCDIDAIINMMVPKRAAGPVGEEAVAGRRLRIGVLRDRAFQFYYEENLEALRAGGAALVEIDALSAEQLPADLDGLYIGGGFPETSARALAENRSFRRSVLAQAEAGLPIYAECGGLIFLGRSIHLDGEEFPLVGLFPVSFGISTKPQAHGYSSCLVEGENSFYDRGTILHGHEFRYSTVERWPGDAGDLAIRVKRGTGFADGRDGLVYKNVLALYTHVLAPATPEWAKGILAAAQRHACRSRRPPEKGPDA